jgi:hypothetical protein
LPARAGGGLSVLALVLWLGGAAVGGPTWGQPEPGQPGAPARPAAATQAEAPAPSEPPSPAEAPAPPEPSVRSERGAVPEEALERIDRALEEVEERIEEGAEAADDASEEVIRARRERVREIREQVHRRLRERGDRSDNKVAFGSSLHIEEGQVAGDAVAIGGSVKIDGDVNGDVVAVGGSVSIDGEVTSVGGHVERAEGAEVVGRINEVAFGPWDPARVVLDRGHRGDWWDWNDHGGWSPFDFGWFGFALSLTGVVVLLLLTALVRLVAGGTVERVRAKAIESPWLCGLVGLAIELFFVPVLVVVCVILAISIIGIPLLLLIPFVILAFLLALIVGFTGVAQAVGEWVGVRFGRSAASPFLALVVGVLSLQVVHVIAELFDSFDGFLWFFALMFGVVGFLIRYAAWTVGIGAVFLTAVRRSSPGAALAVPPPPLPPAAPYPGAPPAPPGDPGWSGQPVVGDRYGGEP